MSTSPKDIFEITEDWPNPGVRFFHLGPWLQNQAAFKSDLLAIARRFSHLGITHIAYLGARGFLMTPLTTLLNCKSVIIRKKGEMPGPVVEVSYSGEYRKDTTIVLRKGDIQKGARVLIVDDVLATGGTAVASIQLLEKAGAQVIGLAFLLELQHLNGRSKIAQDYVVHASYVAKEDGSFCRSKADTCAIPGKKTVLDLTPSPLDASPDDRAVVMWHDTAVEQALALVEKYPALFVPSPVKTNRFPDGHYDIEFNSNLVGRHLVYVMSLLNPEETLHQLELLIALGRQHIQSFTVILNYFAPGTKERVDQPGELARAQTTAQLISDSLKALPTAGPATVVIYDIHAVQEQFYFNDSCSLALLSSTPLMGQIVKDQNMVLVFPDQGAYKRFGKEPQLKHVPTLICNKERGPNDSRVIVIADQKNCEGISEEALLKRPLLIYDDILHSGGTSWETFCLLKKKGYTDINLYATHAVLSNQAWMRFLDSGDRAGFNRIYTTNSVPSVTERFLKYYPEKFVILDLTPITVEFLIQKYKYKPGVPVMSDPLRSANVWYGTKSRPKVAAIQAVFPGAQFLPGTDMSSGVNPQPFGLDEITKGAENRMQNLVQQWLRMDKHELQTLAVASRPTIFVSIESGIIHDDSDCYHDHTVVLGRLYDQDQKLLKTVSSDSNAALWTIRALGGSSKKYLNGPQIPKQVFEKVKESNFQTTAGQIIAGQYPDQNLDDADWYLAKMEGVQNQSISRFDYMHTYLYAIHGVLNRGETQETATVTSGAPSSKAEAVRAILAEFSDCLLPEFSRYETTIPYGESDKEVPAEYLFWSGNGLSFALYITDDDTQLVCGAIPSGTFVKHEEDGYAQKLRKLLSAPNLIGYFAAEVAKPASC